MPQRPLLNYKLRVKRLAAGITEGQLAEAVAGLVTAETGRGAAIDGNYVSKLERGRITWPNSAYRRAFRAFFDAATDAELGFYAMRTRRDAQRWLPKPRHSSAKDTEFVPYVTGQQADGQAKSAHPVDSDPTGHPLHLGGARVGDQREQARREVAGERARVYPLVSRAADMRIRQARRAMRRRVPEPGRAP